MVGFQLEVAKLLAEHKCVNFKDINGHVKRAFGPDIDVSTCIVSGSSMHCEKTLIGDQADITTWLNEHAGSKDLAFVIDIPEDIIPKAWRAKKEPLLCKGGRVAKYFGEENVSTRTVTFSLKLFKNGHFRLKQTLSDSGDAYWSIYEGSYEQNANRIALACILRYTWTTRGSETTIHESVLRSSLAFQTGKSFAVCNGTVPAIVGQETCQKKRVVFVQRISGMPLRSRGLSSGASLRHVSHFMTIMSRPGLCTLELHFSYLSSPCSAGRFGKESSMWTLPRAQSCKIHFLFFFAWKKNKKHRFIYPERRKSCFQCFTNKHYS